MLLVIVVSYLALPTREASARNAAYNRTAVDNASGTYQQNILTDAPLFYFRLGELGVPANGSGTVAANLGSVSTTTSYFADTGDYGGTFTSGVAGTVNDSNTAVLFDGAHSHIDVNTVVLGTLTDFSIEVWVKTSATVNNSRAIFDFFGQNGGFGINVGNGQAQLVIDTGVPKWCQNVANNPICLASSTTVVAGTWYHIVFTRSGATGTIYVNDVATSGAVHTAAFNESTTSTWCFDYSGNECHATLDEGSIYGLALSAARVHAHYVAAGHSAAPPRQPI